MSDTAIKVQEKNDPSVAVKDDNLSPVKQLSEMLKGDMDQVNAEIMRRMQSDVPLIPQLAGYLIASGGKRIRPLLTLASTRLFDDKTDRAFPLAAAVEFIHTATLLHDDVVDGSEERRGKQAANLVFGNQATVLVGDFLFSRAFQQMVADGSLDVLRILSDASAVIAEGEVLQLAAQGNINLTLDEYYTVIAAKTAALFAAACEIGPVIASEGSDTAAALRQYGHCLGMAFQIADDILDYSANRAELGKAIGDDFREGKLTAPVIIALSKASNEELEFWKRTMQDCNQVEGDFEKAMLILEQHNALEEGLSLALEYVRDAKTALNIVPESVLKSTLIDLLEYTVHRKY